MDEATFIEILEDEITFLQDHEISTDDWDDLKNTYINISKSINKNNHSWDEIIQALDKEYKYAEAEKKGIRFSRTGNNEYEQYFEKMGEIFKNIPFENLIPIFAKFAAAESYNENVSFLNFQIYTGETRIKKSTVKDSTRKAQVLTLINFLEAVEINIKDFDKTVLARFLHFLSYEDIPEKIDSSMIYKSFKEYDAGGSASQAKNIKLVINQIEPLAVMDTSGIFKKMLGNLQSKLKIEKG